MDCGKLLQIIHNYIIETTPLSMFKTAKNTYFILYRLL